MTEDNTTPSQRRGLSRRRMLGLTGTGAAVGAATFAGGLGVGRATADTVPAGGAMRRYPFYAPHQSGIVTPAQDRLHFAAFDVTATTREELVTLLQAWTLAAAEMTQGRPAQAEETSYDAPPADTGEADGLPASGLTLTFGFGPSLFRDAHGKDRFGIAARQPRELAALPHFPGDKLDPSRSDGDLCVQACADDPQVAVHAIRNLSRIAFGSAQIRWAQLGFGRTSSTSTAQATPRNLFGFKDGTANLKAEEAGQADEHVWVGQRDDPAAGWMTGGSYLVARRINMRLETWDRASLREQETIIGRDRPQGAPLSGGTEFTEPDLAAKGRGGVPLIAADSHVRLAHPHTNGGVRMLRRGYNFTDGNDAIGRLDAGLFFLAYVRRPSAQYVPMQMRMARQDAMMEYVQHTGSGLFAIPPGARDDGHIGQALFA
ncbi:iron uptake transporter deferrochelatase/peroxidase subunit [Luteipulveratus sp. YIM 133132]|uniref:iron uptake transporter deferrochelatase/peroxidase subunit n=1 Tax=Luteipulveratus flavus TaxID=3031728 RepID=UPI0023AE8DA5|nr:iron uptake transporter deferrochelatase/peroxidase subunit [Luteipulveratus sp. YIM 133132]MDE9366300.1 iron uptake transporter deferrochelatase/peroxidase subunit [Luteipulveratus sp. YIM 133132]